MTRFALLLTMLLWSSTAQADNPDIVAVSMERGEMGWRVSVTLRHEDTGWDHYADAWEIRDPDGKLLGRRTLMHPHENEQPFTRSLRDVMLPDGVPYITIRARCSRDGWVGEEMKVLIDLPY